MKKIFKIISLIFISVIHYCVMEYTIAVFSYKKWRIKKLFLRQKEFNEKAVLDITSNYDAIITKLWLLSESNIEVMYNRTITKKDAIILQKERKERVLTILRNNLVKINYALETIEKIDKSYENLDIGK